MAATTFFVSAVIHKKVTRKTRTTVTLHTFQTAIGWGYHIDIGKNTIIYQPFIPVIETHEGFASKELAEKVGRMVIAKLIAKERPVISIEELRIAGVRIYGKPIGQNLIN